MSGKSQQTASKIERMNADQWEALMGTTNTLTAKQLVLEEFKTLERLQFLIAPIPPPSEGKRQRTQDEYVQEVSVFLAKNEFKADKKQVKKHPSDAAKIVVRRLA